MSRAQRTDLSELRAPLLRLRRRLALQTVANAAATWTPIPLAFYGILRLAARWLPSQVAPVLPFGLGITLAAFGVVLAFVLRAAMTHPLERDLALRIDRSLSERDYLTNALEFARCAPEKRSLLKQTVVDQGLAVLEQIDLRTVAPFRRPRLWPFLALLGAYLAFSNLLAYPSRKRPTSVPIPHRTTVDWSISEDDLLAHEERYSALVSQGTSHVLVPATAAIERLLQDLRRRRVSRNEAFERIAQVTEQLARLPESDLIETQDALSQVGAVLSNHATTRALSLALEGGKPTDVAQALAALKARFADPRRAPSPADLERLRRAIELEKREIEKQRAAQSAERSALMDEKRRLLSTPTSANAKAPTDLRSREIERRLETLDRKTGAKERSERLLSALDRALAEASEAIRKRLAPPSNPFSKLNESLDDAVSARLTDAQKRRLLEELRALEETLANSGERKALEPTEIERFTERAQGSDERERPRSRRNARSESTKATANPAGSALIVGMGLVETEGDGPSSSDATERGKSQGRSLGITHDEQLRGSEATPRQTPELDVTAATASAKDETVSAEVVATSAERGFTRTSYAAVFRAYEPVRESFFLRPQIPQAKRTQVRRYFQLIRPRETPQ